MIRAQGSARERGLQIGEATRQQIQKILAAQDDADTHQDGRSIRHWLPEAQKLLPYIQNYAPTKLAEMEGLAEGAQLCFDDLLLLTCAYEKHVGGSCVEHCT